MRLRIDLTADVETAKEQVVKAPVPAKNFWCRQ